MANAVPHAFSGRRGLRILLTNNSLSPRAGSEIALRDLAIALMKSGHFPVAYSRDLGEIARELVEATIPVIDDLAQLATPPDLIHGQHHLETVTAALHFPLVPVLFVCHGWQPWQEEPPVLPSILHYVAVDQLCRERIIATRGIDPVQVTVIHNAVSLERFPQRSIWPDRPRTALIYSNYARPNDPRTAVIRAACARAGITQVDLLGMGAGNAEADPGSILSNYDIVFAKARCALEAIASGAAVVVTDYAGLAGMVTADNVEHLRAWNFGVRTMQAMQASEDNLVREIQRYNAADAEQVSGFIRTQAGLEATVDRWLSVYDKLLSRHAEQVPDDVRTFLQGQTTAASRYLSRLSEAVKRVDAAELRAYLAETAQADGVRLLEKERAAFQVKVDERNVLLAAIQGSRTYRVLQRLGRIKSRLF